MKQVTGLERAVMGLINQDRFYAEMILQMARNPDPNVLGGAAAVSIQPRITLHYHPDVFEKNSVDDAKSLLKHEVGHLLLSHLTRCGKTMSKLQNVAADLAVNAFIPGFQTLATKDKNGEWTSKPACTVQNLQKDYPSLIPNQTFEWYVAALKKDSKDSGQSLPDSTDDHSQWGVDGSELADVELKSAIQNAVDRTVRAGQAVPAGLRDLIKACMGGRNMWARELIRFPQDAEISSQEDTWRRRNRRMGLQAPGSRKVRKVKIVVGIDVSGSIGGPLLELFYGQCDKIEAAGAEVTAVFFDHDVQKVIPWADVRKMKKVPGGGGTNFQPMLDKAKELKADGLIMLTDGYNADTITKPKYLVIWAVPAKFNYSAPFGKVLKIET